MNLLLTLDRRHGLTTGIVGSLSGVFSWLLAHAPEVASVAGMIGAIATAGIAVLTLAVKLYAIGCRVVSWYLRYRRNAEQRKQHDGYDVPFDGDNWD